VQVALANVIFPDERAREVDDEFFGALQESLKNDGLQVPLLVDKNYRIIDGRTRALAAWGLGWEEIEVQVADTYETMMESLKKAHVNDYVRARLTARRIWEIYSSSKPLMQEYINRIKTMNVTQKKRHRKASAIGRNPLPSCLGIGANTLQSVRMIYRTAEEDTGPLGDFCRSEVERIDTGEISVATSIHRFHDIGRRATGSTDIRTQRNVLGKVLIHLKSIDSALATLGPLSEEATAAEIDEWLNALYVSNTTLFRLRAALRKERESR